MKKLQISFLLILTILTGQGQSQGLSHIPAAFLDIGFGARALGMGGAFVATSNDVHSIIWNPAGLTRTAAWQGTFSYTKQLGIVPYSFLASSGRIDHIWAHGQGLIISGDELMREMRVLFALGRIFPDAVPGLSAGAMLDFRHAAFGRNAGANDGSVSGEAFGLALNLGAQYELNEHIIFGLKLRDILNTINWSTTGLGTYFEGTPFSLVGGIAFKDIKGIHVEVDLQTAFFTDTATRLLLGGEKDLYRYFMLRCGLARNLNGKELNNQYSLGLGLQNIWNDHLRMDFAYLIHDIQNYYRISLVFRR